DRDVDRRGPRLIPRGCRSPPVDLLSRAGQPTRGLRRRIALRGTTPISLRACLLMLEREAASPAALPLDRQHETPAGVRAPVQQKATRLRGYKAARLGGDPPVGF